MAIIIKTEHEIELMRKAGEILAKTHEELKKIIKPGISTYEIDKCGEDFIRSCGCEPSFLNYQGYPASICVSVNDEVVHGIPSKERILQEGDIVYLEKKKKKADKPNYDHVVQRISLGCCKNVWCRNDRFRIGAIDRGNEAKLF